MQDHLTDFERAEFYKSRYQSRGTLIVIFSVLLFFLGFAVARFIYRELPSVDNKKDNTPVKRTLVQQTYGLS